MDRLSMEFPHLTREQLHSHEEHCDALKFVSQRQNAAFRGWRRDRQALLRRHQGIVEDKRRNSEAAAARRLDMEEQRGRQRKLHNRLEVQRARASSENARRRQSEEEAKERARAAEEARERAHLKHIQGMKKLTLEYAEKKKEKLQQQQEAAADSARRQAEENALLQERNAERVRLRRDMDDLK